METAAFRIWLIRPKRSHSGKSAVTLYTCSVISCPRLNTSISSSFICVSRLFFMLFQHVERCTLHVLPYPPESLRDGDGRSSPRREDRRHRPHHGSGQQVPIHRKTRHIQDREELAQFRFDPEGRGKSEDDPDNTAGQRDDERSAENG